MPVDDLIADRYELRDELGAGGMARVMAAYDRTLNRDVAVKLLHRDVLAQAGGRDRFLHEARSAASFSHPSAVAVYDTGTEGGIPYIVMELVDGPTLAEVLEERGALTPPEASAVASQLLAALGAAHRRGLVHRDIKPANVLVPEGRIPTSAIDEPFVKLADFGIAKGIEQAQSGLTATGQVLGTPKYVSPEQVGGAPATPRSDVYSMGVVLYEMLAGEPPFSAESPLALALAHRNDPVPKLERRVRGLDRGLAKVVHKALDKNPGERFADADEFRQALADPRLVPAPVATATRPFDPAEAPTEALARDGQDQTAAMEPERRGPWRLVMLVAALALVALAVVAVDWGGLIDGFLPEETEEPEVEPDEDVDPEDADPAPEPDAPEDADPAPEDDADEEAPEDDPPVDEEEDPPPADEAPDDAGPEDEQGGGDETNEGAQGGGPDGDGPPGQQDDPANADNPGDADDTDDAEGADDADDSELTLVPRNAGWRLTNVGDLLG